MYFQDQNISTHKMTELNKVFLYYKNYRADLEDFYSLLIMMILILMMMVYCSLKHASYIMVGAWSFSIFLASLPLFGISDYRKGGISNTVFFPLRYPLALNYLTSNYANKLKLIKLLIQF